MRNPLELLATLLCTLLATGLATAQQGFPGASWPTATPESQGLDSTVLSQSFAALPWPASDGPVLVIANGHEVFRVGDPAQTEYLFSCSKLITAMVCARLRQQGSIGSLDDLVPNSWHVGAWSGYPGDSSYRQFMTMTSDYGLSPYHPVSGQYAYNNNAIDFYGEAVSQHFYGNSVDQMNLTVDTALCSLIGKQDSLSFNDQWGGWGGDLRISARDFARLGYLLLRGGQWNGQQLLHPEFTGGLFRSQLPATALPYAGLPTENSQWNQQSVTDLLAGSWSFGLWRVGDADTQGHWSWAAAEGYRGKRLILCPKGSLPDPDLEVVLVCLPQLPDEGPGSQQYVDILKQAAEAQLPAVPPAPDNVAATFEDGLFAPLEARSGPQTIRNGDWVTSAQSRALLANHQYQDLDALVLIAPDMPIGSSVGLIVRAENAADTESRLDGPQTFLRLTRNAQSNYSVTLLYHDNQQPVSVTRNVVAPLLAVQPTEMLVTLRGDRIWCRIKGDDVLGPQGWQGIPNPDGGGLLSLWGDGNGSEVGVRHLLVRPAGAPAVYPTVDGNGEVQLALFDPYLLYTVQVTQLHAVIGPVFVDANLLVAVQPSVWPTVLGFGQHHVLLSSTNAAFRLPSGTPLVFTYQGKHAGILAP